MYKTLDQVDSRFRGRRRQLLIPISNPKFEDREEIFTKKNSIIIIKELLHKSHLLNISNKNTRNANHLCI